MVLNIFVISVLVSMKKNFLYLQLFLTNVPYFYFPDMQMLDKFKIFIIPSIRKDVKVTYVTEKIRRLGGTILNSHQSLSTIERCDDNKSVIFLIDKNEPLDENIAEVRKYQKFAEMKKYLIYSKQEISDFVARIESKIKPKQVSSPDLAKRNF